MSGREKVKVNNGKLLALILGILAAATSFADRTANQGWVTENFVSRTNEWKLAERRHALFILDLNAENAGKWRSFELKASTNNFAHISGGEAANMVFWGCSDEADGYADGVNPILADRGQDRMRLYCSPRGAAGTGGRGRRFRRRSTSPVQTRSASRHLSRPTSVLTADGSERRTRRSSGATRGPMRREPKRTPTERPSGIRWSR